jgi:type I restriction enzyme M protein
MTRDVTGLDPLRARDIEESMDSACERLSRDGVPPEGHVEQLAWLFYLKIIDEVESRLEGEAKRLGRTYIRRLDAEYRWSTWAGKFERASELFEFVEGDLWPYLRAFGATAPADQYNDAIAERFRRVFSELHNQCSADTLMSLVQRLQGLDLTGEANAALWPRLYEGLLRRAAGDASAHGREGYTHRHIVSAMVHVLRPGSDDSIYDPCCGTAGFLIAAARYRAHERAAHPMLEDAKLRRRRRLVGRELNPITHLLGLLNVMFNRIEGADLRQGDALGGGRDDEPSRDRYDIILTHPPCSGQRGRGAFLEHVMDRLADGGRAGVIVPEGVLGRGGASARLRERLLSDFDVHTVLSLPPGCFLPYSGGKTSILFFDRRSDGHGTEQVWFYELNDDGFELNPTRRPTGTGQWSDFLAKRSERRDSDVSWSMTRLELGSQSWELCARNPRRRSAREQRSSLELLDGIRVKEERILELLGELRGLLGEQLP